MRKGISTSKLFGFFLALALMTTATLAFARPYAVRVVDPRVNTLYERHFDYNHNGRIDPWERRMFRERSFETTADYRYDTGRVAWLDHHYDRYCY